MAEKGYIDFADQPSPQLGVKALVPVYSRKKSPDPVIVARVEELQRWLNTYPGIFVRVDGVPGNFTSDAYKKVTGHYLPGDSRSGL